MSTLNIQEEEFAATLQKFVRGNLPVKGICSVEGVPYSGKTTFVRHYVAKQVEPCQVISEHTIYDTSLNKLAAEECPVNDCDTMYQRQKHFFNIEVCRGKQALEYLNTDQSVMMDRCFLSPYIYSWLRLSQSSRSQFFEKVYHHYYTRFVLPEKMYYLSINPENCLKTATLCISQGDKRATEAFFLQSSTIDSLQVLYTQAMNVLLQQGVIIESQCHE